MSKIEREMIAEARAARQRQEAADIGADVPSAPNDEQTLDWWQYADVLANLPAATLPPSPWPPLCREDDAAKTRSAVNLLECYGWRWEHGVWQVPNA